MEEVVRANKRCFSLMTGGEIGEDPLPSRHP